LERLPSFRVGSEAGCDERRRRKNPIALDGHGRGARRGSAYRNERADTVVIGSGIAGLLARAASDYTRRQPALVFGFSSGINEEDIGL
jgi:hypothetical protein